MAVLLISPTFYSSTSLSRHAKESLQSRSHSWPFPSRSIMKYKLQPHNVFDHGTCIGHYVQRPRASSDENGVTEAPLKSDSDVEKEGQKKDKVKEVRKGQITAIWTGAVAVLLGIGYLILIQILDTRGIVLQPPPPEAFDP